MPPYRTSVTVAVPGFCHPPSEVTFSILLVFSTQFVFSLCFLCLKLSKNAFLTSVFKKCVCVLDCKGRMKNVCSHEVKVTTAKASSATHSRDLDQKKSQKSHIIDM